MEKKSGLILRLAGELRFRGADWTLEELRNLFQRLGDNLAKTGVMTRYIRYFGESGERTEVRFFGLQVDSVAKIPEGMVALELAEDTFTVKEQKQGKVTILWQNPLTWDWLDRSVPGFPVGDFRVRVPDNWIPQPNSKPLRFILATNSYFEKGMTADDEIRLVDYDPIWPEKFKEMEAWLRKNIPPEILLRVEHFGSTSIPDMPAKPVIDILIEVPSYNEARRILIPILNKPECEYWWSDGHMAFYVRDKLMGTRIYHLHVACAGQPVEKWITFRDYLRTHPEDAQRYAALKYDLAARHTSDREAYTDAKGLFVQEIVDKAQRKHQ
jgi:GrpB-like predicted nucleotidyltransferase (UPF0157 family)